MEQDVQYAHVQTKDVNNSGMTYNVDQDTTWESMTGVILLGVV